MKGDCASPGICRGTAFRAGRASPWPDAACLLLAEQGVGDTLHFFRYARLLKERGARVVLAAQAPLGRLLASHPDVDELFLLGSPASCRSVIFIFPC